eukprot:1725970-Lingulodinium_polyedra.AAC.1
MEGFLGVTLEPALDITVFGSLLAGSFDIITLEHMLKLKGNSIVGNSDLPDSVHDSAQLSASL